MKYNKMRSLVFVETVAFTKRMSEYLSDDEYRALQEHMMNDPEVGKIIRGSGGARKIRWSRNGIGKSGGIRVIYYWAKARNEIYMLTIYSKSEKENLDKNTLSQIAGLLEKIK